MRALARARDTAVRARLGLVAAATLWLAQATAATGHLEVIDGRSTTRPYTDDTLTVETVISPDPLRPTWDVRNIEFTSHLDPSTLENGVSIRSLRFGRAEFRGSSAEITSPRLFLSNGEEFCPAATNFVSSSFTFVTRLRFVNGLPADVDASFRVQCNGSDYTTVNGVLRYTEPALLATDLVMVRGFAWFDENRNGIRDEPFGRAIGGVDIRAVAVDPVPADAAVLAVPHVRTGSEGMYEIWLRPQAYQFIANCPQGYAPTAPNASRNDFDDSDFTTAPNPLNAQGTGPTLVPANSPMWGPDIGCRSTRNFISGYVWHDADRDGQRSNFEGTPGAIRLMRFDNATQTWVLFAEPVVESNGHFTAEVDDGRWRVEFPAAQAAGGGASAATARDAGKFEETDSDLLPDGTTAPVDIVGGGLWTQFDVGFVDRIGAVRGLVWRDQNGDGMAYREPGEFGVSVSLLRGGKALATTLTDEQGIFLFNHVVQGDDYQLRLNMDIPVENRRRAISPPNAIGDDSQDSDLDPRTLRTGMFSTLGEGQTLATLGIGLKAPGLATVEGRVWQDRNANGLRDKGEPPLAGLPIQVMRASATGEPEYGGSTTSDAKGEYAIDVVAGRRWTVTIVPSTGWSLSPPSVNGANDSDVGGLPFDLRTNQSRRRDIGVFQTARTTVPLADYWPLHVGASWSYGNGPTPDFVLRVKRRTTLHGSTVYVVAESQSGSEYLLSMDDKGLRLHGLNSVGLGGDRLQGEANTAMPWAPGKLRSTYRSSGSTRVHGKLVSGGTAAAGEGTLNFRTSAQWTPPVYQATNPQPDVDIDFNANGRMRGEGGAVDLQIATNLTLRRGVGPVRWRVNGSDAYLIRYKLDADGDRINADHDNCPGKVNQNQADRDGDGVGDPCDLDDDEDFRLDTADNCPKLANTDQRNRDGDALGDACDPKPTRR